MTDEQKIAWFDETIRWFDHLADVHGGDPMDACDVSTDMALDLFAEVNEQWKKVRK